ncbi:MAG TPA: dCTP deaminase [Bryobacteraceae bacterium]|nr:dCTP deaminase [Bryobacteraceae bacterium]
MILTDHQIIAAYKQGEIVIEPFDEHQVQGATYDLRIGEQGATTTSKKVVNIKQAGFITIQPGDFAVITVDEILRLGPQYVGRFGLRSKFARKGLIATTGPQVDPGYHGRLIIGMTNLSPKPVTLSYGDDLLSIEFHKLSEASTRPYSGPYQDRLTLGPEEIEAITENEGMALSEVLTTLRSLSQNVGALTAEMKTFRWLIPLMIAFGIAVVAIIVSLKK